MKRIAFIVVQLFVIGMATAAPETFKCSRSEGTRTIDLVVDIEKKTLVLGNMNYTIHAIDDSYISAYLNIYGAVGGEVFVLNRITGDYLSANVFKRWENLELVEKNVPGRVTADTGKGRCTKPLL